MATVSQSRKRDVDGRQSRHRIRLVHRLVFDPNLRQPSDRTDLSPGETLPGRYRCAQDLSAGIADPRREHGILADPLLRTTDGDVDHLVSYLLPTWILWIRRLGIERELAVVPRESPTIVETCRHRKSRRDDGTLAAPGIPFGNRSEALPPPQTT